MKLSEKNVVATLMPMITGHMLARTIHAATSLGIMDLLDAIPATPEAMAQATDTDPAAIKRLLQALGAVGLAKELGDGTFEATELGAPLRRHARPSLRNLVLMFGAERSWRSWENLSGSLRDGLPASRALYGMTGFEYFERHPDIGQIFHAAMGEATEHVAAALTKCVDLSRFGSIADIGGGSGLLLARVLAAAPAARGLLFDLPEALAEAPTLLREAGVHDRCDIVSGDFFTAIPPGQEAYLMKNVLHDWEDSRCVGILRNARLAMDAGSSLFVIERLRPLRAECDPAHRQTAMMDMNMMVTTGGRERSEREFVSLFDRAGLELIGEPHALSGTAHYAALRLRPLAS